MKPWIKTIFMIIILVCGILYVDLTVNSLMGTPRILVIDYAKEQLSQVFDNISK